MNRLFTKYQRAWGTLFAIFCFGLAYWYADRTLWLAETKQPENIMLLKAFPALIGLGIIFTFGAVAGDKMRTYSANLRGRRKTLKDAFFFALILVPAMAGYFWLVWALKERGYEIL